MNPIEDLFAFTTADYGAPNEKKKKRKKKKLFSPKPELSIADANALTNGSSATTFQLNSRSTTTAPLLKNLKNDTPSTKVNDNKEEELLTNLLGLSETTSTLSKSEIPVLSSDNKEIINNPLEVEDAFLASLNSYMNTVKKTDSEIENLLRTQQQEQIKINGALVESKSVKFEFHIVIQAAGQVSGSYDLQVKGSTKISKLISTLMVLFNQDANPKFPEDNWSSLVLYIEDLNIILNPSLKCFSLLAYKNQLQLSSNITGFEVTAMITVQEHAQMLHSIEKEKRMGIQKHLLNNQEEEGEEDNYSGLLNIDIYDYQNQLNSDANVIDIDEENVVEPKISKMAIDRTMPISELINIYKYKVQLPMDLNISIYLNDDTPLEPDETLAKYNVKENDTLKVTYNVDELNTLKLRNEVEMDADADLDDLELDNYDRDIQRDRSRSNDDSNTNAEDMNEEYFPVIVVGKDKKRFKVDIKPSTKISAIAKYYLQKAGLLESTKVKLLFDDEELDLNDTVQNTELEEDFMIDVIIS